MNRLNISEVNDILINDFNWNKTGNMVRNNDYKLPRGVFTVINLKKKPYQVKNYKYLNKRKTLDEFLATLETTLHYVADILIDFQNETYSERVNECFYKFVGGPTYSRPGL